MRFRNLILSALVLVLLPAVWPGGVAAQEQPQPEIRPFQTVEIVTKSGVRAFSVEVAATEEQLSRGLMHRTELPEGRGMLFDFKNERIITMWMKNTPLSLDMIFVGRNGAVVRVAEHTTPFSTQTISSGVPALAVLEVIAGTARKFGIAPGDRMVHSMFRPR
jgi:uncharacterized membrane protein (UPF0127 family)